MGKTEPCILQSHKDRKHPHARGEDTYIVNVETPELETSPRPWGRPVLRVLSFTVHRNIPTPVGKTMAYSRGVALSQKHPHARGEDSAVACMVTLHWETSPRPWGRLYGQALARPAVRNIPTPVGKTGACNLLQIDNRKHPHARGEDAGGKVTMYGVTETSPRPWGRLVGRCNFVNGAGNIPTPVGKTLCHGTTGKRTRKHPHARGEDCFSPPCAVLVTETSPRPWGRHSHSLYSNNEVRNIPTPVGKTLLHHLRTTPTKKHPHARGEDALDLTA